MNRLKEVALIAEYQEIERVLQENKNCKTATAKALGVDRKTLYYKIVQYKKHIVTQYKKHIENKTT